MLGVRPAVPLAEFPFTGTDDPMTLFEIMLLVIAVGFLLLGIGFANRAQDWGVALIALGWLCMLLTLAYKMYLAFG